MSLEIDIAVYDTHIYTLQTRPKNLYYFVQTTDLMLQDKQNHFSPTFSFKE